MFKKIALYLVVFGVLFFFARHIQEWALQKQGIALSFSLFNVYLFHTVFSFLVCTSFAILANKSKWFDQLGFVYLVVLVVKIVVFYLVFYGSIFSSDKLLKTDSISLLIPMVIFLIAEVYIIAEILNSK